MIPDLQALNRQLEEHFRFLDVDLQSLAGYVPQSIVDSLRNGLHGLKQDVRLTVEGVNREK